MVHFTSDCYACLSFLLTSRIDVEHAAEAPLIPRPHSSDGDVTGPSVRSLELDIWVLEADVCRRARFVGQHSLSVWVEPAHLVDGVARRSSEGTAEVQRLTNLDGDSGGGSDHTKGP